jgi:hypothetical protein
MQIGSAFFWGVMQRVVAPYRRFGTAYHPFFKVQEISLKMKTMGYPERSVRDCHHRLRNNPEERGSQLKPCGKLRSVPLPPDSQYLGALDVQVFGLFVV